MYTAYQGVSSDFRDLLKLQKRVTKSKIALEVYSITLPKYMGSYVAAMNSVMQSFYNGIGENDELVRRDVCSYLGYLGINIDLEKNDSREDEMIISTPDSKVKVCVIATNEELAIARETVALI